MRQEASSSVPEIARQRLCQDMIEMLRAQQRGDLIIEEFAHFTNEELENIVQYLSRERNMPKQERMFTISGNNTGLSCPFKPTFCQEEGSCKGCQIFLDWREKS